MSDEKRFEDRVSVDDLMKKPQKELLTMIYIQTVKTNGTVAENCKDIASLQLDMKDKIGMKLFRNLTIILGVIITATTLIQLFVK
jgi:hypothetical protein